MFDIESSPIHGTIWRTHVSTEFKQLSSLCSPQICLKSHWPVHTGRPNNLLASPFELWRPTTCWARRRVSVHGASNNKLMQKLMPPSWSWTTQTVNCLTRRRNWPVGKFCLGCGALRGPTIDSHGQTFSSSPPLESTQLGYPARVRDSI